jgi:hypothetical protein
MEEYVQPTKEVMDDIDIEQDEDELIVKKVLYRIAETKDLHEERKKIASENLKLFRGLIDELATEEKADFNSKVVLSRLFFIIRNLVGLSTDNPPHVIISPDKDNKKSVKKAKKIEQNVEWGALRTSLNDILAMCLFDTWIKSDSFIHWFWNYDINDFDIEPLRLEDVLISNDAEDLQDAEYVIMQPLRNRQWFKKNYPEQYDEIMFDSIKDKNGDVKEISDNNKRGIVTRVYTYLENDLEIIMARKEATGSEKNYIILKKGLNPYFEYRTPEEQMQEAMPDMLSEDGLMSEEAEMQMQDFQPITNYFQFPRKPIVQIPSIKLLGELYSEDILSQVKSIFISMNNKKRAYNDNMAGCNNKYVYDTNSMTQEEADKISNEPNQVIGADFNENSKPFYMESGKPIPNDFHKDIAHDEQYIDDVFGHHDISRGSGNADTLGQDQMNAESDRTPVRYQVRATERAIVELTQGWLQLMKMFYTEKHYAKKFAQDDSVELVELMNDDIEEGNEPLIKPASTMPVSKEGQKRQALEMFGAGALDPYTMYTKMDMGNPEELANRLVNWIQGGIVDPQDPEEVQSDMMAQDMNAGDGLDNTIERANSENLQFAEGKEVEPTPPELLSEEHVKLHISFANDSTQKMEEEDRDTLLAHAEVDKAGLIQMKAEAIALQSGQQQQQQPQQPQQ